MLDSIQFAHHILHFFCVRVIAVDIGKEAEKVFGNAHSGEAVKAWVVLKPGKSLTVEELRAFCKENLAGYKVPKEVVFMDQLPRTNVGKILRRELVRMHQEGK